MWFQFRVLAAIAFFIGSNIAQKYQYSTGWTNGAEGEKTRKVYDECRLMTTEAILGKPLSPRYFSECVKGGLPKSEFEVPFLLNQNRFVFPSI